MQIIYDIGMHKGEDSDYYLKKGFHVVGVEANPVLSQACAERFAEQIASGQMTVVNKAIAEEAGHIDFYVCDNRSVWGTADKNWMLRNEAAGESSHRIQVDAVTIKDLIHKYGTPWYLKVDIEGFDYLCLEGLRDCEEMPQYVSIESSATREADTRYQLDLLRELGYRRFKVIPQHNIDQQKVPDPPQEGKYVDHQFPMGSSGVFGRDLPGEWGTFDEVIREYKKIYRHVSMIGSHNGRFRNVKNRYLNGILNRWFPLGRGWYDTHASL